ncbi:MAG: hypothetical protein WA510_14850 [Acidobacteriaceae bacterium]
MKLILVSTKCAQFWQTHQPPCTFQYCRMTHEIKGKEFYRQPVSEAIRPCMATRHKLVPEATVPGAFDFLPILRFVLPLWVCGVAGNRIQVSD